MAGLLARVFGGRRARTAPRPRIDSALRMLSAGDYAAAAEALREEASAHPDDAQARYLLGSALGRAGDLDGATAALERAVALAPRLVPAHVDLGNVYKLREDNAAAARCYRKALALEPGNAPAWSNLSNAQKCLGDPTGALASARRAVELAPGLADAHNNLGFALQELNRLADAEAALRQAIALAPGYAEAWNNLGNVLADRGATVAAVDAYRRCLVLAPRHASAHSNLLLTLHYDPALAASAVFEAHQAWGRLHPQPLAPAPTPAAADGRLRVGYLSPDFRTHSVARFIEGVLAAHDRARVHLTAYADGTRRDAISTRIAGCCDAWVEVSGLDDEALAARIRGDAMDVLVDLCGHAAGNRLRVFARRAAPVQVTWIGYPDTTGLATMDARITDEVADPPGAADSLHTEALARVAGGFLCYRPQDDAPPVSAPPVQSAGVVTFGCFNNAAKLNAGVAALWARVLAAVPGSRLLLKARQLGDPDTAAGFAALFTRAGIAPQRLLLEGWVDDGSEHLARYADVDIALDPFPYNGTTTTCEALWMGVPVVALEGDRHCARVGASLLRAAGLEDLSAHDEAAYVRIAATLAGDHEGLATLRAGLRARLGASPLLDTARVARSVETIYARLRQATGAQVAAPGGAREDGPALC